MLFLDVLQLKTMNDCIAHSKLSFFRFYLRGTTFVRFFKFNLFYFIVKQVVGSVPSVTDLADTSILGILMGFGKGLKVSTRPLARSQLGLEKSLFCFGASCKNIRAYNNKNC